MMRAGGREGGYRVQGTGCSGVGIDAVAIDTYGRCSHRCHRHTAICHRRPDSWVCNHRRADICTVCEYEAHVKRCVCGVWGVCDMGGWGMHSPCRCHSCTASSPHPRPGHSRQCHRRRSQSECNRDCGTRIRCLRGNRSPAGAGMVRGMMTMMTMMMVLVKMMMMMMSWLNGVAVVVGGCRGR